VFTNRLIYEDKIFKFLIDNGHTERFRKLVSHNRNSYALENIFETALQKNNLEIANIIIDSLNNGYLATSFYKKVIALNLSEAAERIFPKLPDDDYFLRELSLDLIKAEKYDQALKVSEKITSEYNLSSLTEEFLKAKQYENALQLSFKTNSDYQLERMALQFCELNQPEFAFKLAEKIENNDNYLKNIISKFIELNQPDFAIELSKKLKRSFHLRDIAESLLEKDQPELAFKLIESIKSPNSLMEFGEKFVSKNKPELALQMAIKIISTDDTMKDYYSYTIAQELIKKGELETAAKLIPQLPKSSFYGSWIQRDIAKKTKELQNNAAVEVNPKGTGTWSILPTAEAIDESFYRKIYDPTQNEIDFYRSYKDGYKPLDLTKLPEFDLNSRTTAPKQIASMDSKMHGGNITLPETDLTAVAFIAARAAKFFANKLLAKPEIDKNKKENRKKNKKGESSKDR